MLELVVFDVDGLMLDTESVWKEAFDRQNNFELKQNEKLGKEIKK